MVYDYHPFMVIFADRLLSGCLHQFLEKTRWKIYVLQLLKRLGWYKLAELLFHAFGSSSLMGTVDRTRCPRCFLVCCSLGRCSVDATWSSTLPLRALHTSKTSKTNGWVCWVFHYSIHKIDKSVGHLEIVGKTSLNIMYTILERRFVGVTIV